MMAALIYVVFVSLFLNSFSFRFTRPAALGHVSGMSRSSLYMGSKQRAWGKGDLSDKDIFEDEDNSEEGSKKKNKLQPEAVFQEGPPDASEVFLPALSIITVIGVVPFISALSRQFWVRYKFTSRRISIQSGINGKDQSEIIYPDIEEIRFVFRAFGSAGDMVLFLKDGAKVELRHVTNFRAVYEYILSQCDEECKEKSMSMPPAPA